MFSLLSYTAQDHLPRLAPLTVDWALLYKLLIKKMLPQTVPKAMRPRGFSQLRFSFKIPILCHVQKKKSTNMQLNTQLNTLNSAQCMFVPEGYIHHGWIIWSCHKCKGRWRNEIWIFNLWRGAVCWIRNVPIASHIWTLASWLVALFEDVMGSLGDGTFLEEIYHRG